ncbi:MAG: hypothetical protein IPJ74_14440 [Saprospiraceae bacterium]|nr:hypothetical protein [Saprospiraceae bacterium]
MKYLIEERHELLDKFHNTLFPNFSSEINVKPVLITSIKLSDTAKSLLSLRVSYEENVKLEAYPIIKCHISRETGEKIYHLPFDQQYDKTKIFGKNGCFYSTTTYEAEEKGFRRAYRWRGITET